MKNERIVRIHAKRRRKGSCLDANRHAPRVDLADQQQRRSSPSRIRTLVNTPLLFFEERIAPEMPADQKLAKDSEQRDSGQERRGFRRGICGSSVVDQFDRATAERGRLNAWARRIRPGAKQRRGYWHARRPGRSPKNETARVLAETRPRRSDLLTPEGPERFSGRRTIDASASLAVLAVAAGRGLLGERAVAGLHPPAPRSSAGRSCPGAPHGRAGEPDGGNLGTLPGTLTVFRSASNARTWKRSSWDEADLLHPVDERPSLRPDGAP